jgi:hypothetical protein
MAITFWSRESLGGLTRPVIAGVESAFHRYILWWALIFGLSMRARYELAGWTRDLDVDHSWSAVPLEPGQRLR